VSRRKRNQNVGALEEQTAAKIDAHLGVNMRGRCRIVRAIWGRMSRSKSNESPDEAAVEAMEALFARGLQSTGEN
jgi:hypothetical protein